MILYTVRGSATANAAAPKDFLTIAPAANARIAVVGLTIGHTAATSAQGTGWQLLAAAVAATGSAFTPIVMDQGIARTAKSTVLSTITANASGGVILEEFGFDIVGSYTKWYPPGKEYWIDQTIANNIFVVRKSVGSETTAQWNITVYYME